MQLLIIHGAVQLKKLPDPWFVVVINIKLAETKRNSHSNF